MSVALAVLLSLAAQPAASPTPPEELVLTGQVREVAGGVGGRAQVTLRQEDGTEVMLHGISAKLQMELRRLSGVRVRVSASELDSRVPVKKHVRVHSYEILEVGGGKVPRLGHLAELQLSDGPRLIFVEESGKAHLMPKGWSRKMWRHVGSKLWIVGKARNRELKPSRFAILSTLATPGGEASSQPKAP